MKKIIIKIIDWLYLPFVQRLISKKTFRYGLTGGGNMMLDAILYFVFYHFILDKSDLNMGIVVISPEIASYLLTFPIVFFTGLWLAKNITFQNSILSDNTQRGRYLLVTMTNILIKYVGIKGLVIINFFPSIANIIMTVVTIIFSYIMQHYFTFKGNKTI